MATHRQQSTKISSGRNVGRGGAGNDNGEVDDGNGDSRNDDDDDGGSSGRRATTTVGTLPEGYLCNIPLPRVPRTMSLDYSVPSGYQDT